MFQIVLLKSFSYFCLVPLLCSVQQSNLTSKCVQQLFISLIFTILVDFFSFILMYFVVIAKIDHNFRCQDIFYLIFFLILHYFIFLFLRNFYSLLHSINVFISYVIHLLTTVFLVLYFHIHVFILYEKQIIYKIHV